MADDPHSRGGPPTYRQDGVSEPSHAERTRTLLAGSTDGTLSTVALNPEGHPFGSIVTFAVAADGAPLILMSTMAEHANNLDADPRSSLLVSASGEGAGRLAAGAGNAGRDDQPGRQTTSRRPRRPPISRHTPVRSGPASLTLRSADWT